MLKLKDGFYAKDEDGDVYWYENYPSHGKYQWDQSGGDYEETSGISIDEPWQDSLYEVRDGIPVKVNTYVKDQKVLVRDHERYEWKRRHYSHYGNGAHEVFGSGTTSFTSKCTIPYNYIKPYSEEDDADSQET